MERAERPFAGGGENVGSARQNSRARLGEQIQSGFEFGGARIHEIDSPRSRLYTNDHADRFLVKPSFWAAKARRLTSAPRSNASGRADDRIREAGGDLLRRLRQRAGFFAAPVRRSGEGADPVAAHGLGRIERLVGGLDEFDRGDAARRGDAM